MKKVGIVTYFTPDNYGALLQAYALQRAIEKCGRSCEIINYVCKFRVPRKFRLPRHPVRLMKFIWDKVVEWRCGPKKRNGFNRFREKLKMSERFDTSSDIKVDRYSIVVTGSDQVWNPHINEEDPAYWLSFVTSGIRKIAYAPSFGVARLTNEQLAVYSAYLHDFTAVSCRESDGVELIRNRLGRADATLALDPTLLLDIEEYAGCLEQPKRMPPYFVFCYYVGKINAGNPLIAIAERKARILGAQLVLASNEVTTQSIFSPAYLNPSPGEFLSWIQNAAAVVTNSFHGMVFSILNHRDFLVYTGSGRENRMASLLDQLGLSERLLSEVPEDYSLPDGLSGDYYDVMRRLENMRQLSWSFLRGALNEK